MAIVGFEVQTWRAGLLLGHFVTWIASAYCYWFVRKLSLGLPRVLACIPVFIVYAYLPLIFNRETHLVGIASFFCIITWMSSFKVLLLCWGTGPGYDPWVTTCFPRFAIVMTYPAHMKRTGKVVKRVPVKRPSWIVQVTKSEVWYMLLVRSALKLSALAVLVQLLLRRELFPMTVVHLLFSIQLYLFVTIVLEILAALANTMFGITMEPHFDNPFAADSLEEFWARRWNLLVSNALRETVFNPVLYLLQGSKEAAPQKSRAKSSSNGCIEKPQELGVQTREREDARRFDAPKLVAMLAAFLVSGLAHELAVYYVTLRVTGQMTSFFVVQGLTVALEVAWKISYPNVRPPEVVAKVLTLGFAFITAHLLFWPPMDQTADQVIGEMHRLLTFQVPVSMSTSILCLPIAGLA